MSVAKVNRTDGEGGSQETIRERGGDCRGKAQILGQQASGNLLPHGVQAWKGCWQVWR